MIRPATTADASAICTIYNHYVENTVVTFEEEPVSEQQMAERIDAVLSKDLPWLVDEEDSKVLGYAYLAPWASRSAYRFSLETSIYLDPDSIGTGHGTRLFESLMKLLPSTGAHVTLGVIALPNPGSIVLHEKFGFTKAGHFEEVGFKFDRWIDVGMWQIRL